jgi:hypothetical protein
MPQKQKINRAKVEASLNTLCPKCGRAIAPAELRRVDFERVVMPGVPGAIHSRVQGWFAPITKALASPEFWSAPQRRKPRLCVC